MTSQFNHLLHQTRRHFLGGAGLGLGSIALGSMLHDDTRAATLERTADPLLPRQPHFAAKATRVIYLHMTGSPPILDLFEAWRGAAACESPESA